MEGNINAIIRIFPGFEGEIKHLFIHDEGFRELCADYMLCADNILQLKREGDKQTMLIKEYEDLQRTLGEELLKVITKNM